MKHKLLPIFGLLAIGGLGYALNGAAQHDTPRSKMDAAVTRILKQHAAQSHATRGAADGSDAQITVRGLRVKLNAPLRLSIVTADGTAESVLARVAALGGSGTVITPSYLTATLTAAAVDSVAAMPEVLRVNFPRRFRPNLKKARTDAGVTKVHTGTGLTTPFTGRGVVVAVIDQGFEYRHAAFLDPKTKASRVKMLWDRSLFSDVPEENKDTKPTDVIPSGTEKAKFDTGHATHVTNIAAGSDTGNGLQGVAPEADIVMIPSSFYDAELTEDVKFVKEFAEKNKQPWVLNMSFGSQTGPHDGTTDYDRTVDAMLDAPGGFITAAIGNEGDLNQHTQGTFQPGETKYLLADFDFLSLTELEESESAYMNVDIWGQAADGKKHFEVTPFIYSGGEMLPQTEEFWKAVIDESSERGTIAPNNKKEHHGYYLDMRAALKNAVIPGEGDGEEEGNDDLNMKIGFKITAYATNAGPETLHAWVDGNGLTAGVNTHPVKGHEAATLKADNLYIVGEGAASIPRAIAVGCYATEMTYKGEKLDNDKVGDRTKFSSNGPTIDGRYAKPAVLAPGAFINSAQNKLAASFDPDDEDALITTSVGKGKDKSWYGLMEGTSQSSPFMAGVIALWLQANPSLTYADVMKILQKTSRKHARMSGKDWTPEYGYGLVDAYEGLKEALELAKTTAIERPAAQAAPVSVATSPDRCRVLFNNPEREATVSVFTLDGRAVQTHRMEAVEQGREITISLSDVPAGVYVLRITTPGARLSQRLVVTH